MSQPFFHFIRDEFHVLIWKTKTLSIHVKHIGNWGKDEKCANWIMEWRPLIVTRGENRRWSEEIVQPPTGNRQHNIYRWKQYREQGGSQLSQRMSLSVWTRSINMVEMTSQSDETTEWMGVGGKKSWMAQGEKRREEEKARYASPECDKHIDSSDNWSNIVAIVYLLWGEE